MIWPGQRRIRDSILKAEGFETKVILKGLGEIDAIADMFVKHLNKAEEI